MIAAPSPCMAPRSGEKSIATVSDTARPLRVAAPGRRRERIRVQPTPVDLDAQQLLDPHVGEPDVRPEVLEHGELARLRRRLEDQLAKAEGLDEALRMAELDLALGGEEADLLGALATLDDQRGRADAQPAAPELDQLVHPTVVERAVVLLAELELEAEPAVADHARHFLRSDLQVGEALAALDAVEAHVGAQVQVCGQFALRGRDLE